MNEALRFSFDTTPRNGRPRSRRLSVIAPTEVINQVLMTPEMETLRRDSRRDHILVRQIGANGRDQVVLNCGLIGSNGLQNKHHRLTYPLKFYTGLAQLAQHGVVGHDPRLRLEAFGAVEDGDAFTVAATVAQPKADSAAVGQLIRMTMLDTAFELRVNYGRRSREDYEEYIQTDVQLAAHDVRLTVGNSVMARMGRPPRPDAERFNLVGKHVLDGEQPLIYLVGLVALAHADELV